MFCRMCRRRLAHTGPEALAAVKPPLPPAYGERSSTYPSTSRSTQSSVPSTSRKTAS
jgi:hypothetical protein